MNPSTTSSSSSPVSTIAAESHLSPTADDRLFMMERELSMLRNSTRAALQQSWDEVESLERESAALADRAAGLEEELEASKAAEEYWKRRYEELFHSSGAAWKPSDSAVADVLERRASSVIQEDADGMLIVVTRESVEKGRRSLPSNRGNHAGEGFLGKLRRRCSMEVAGRALSSKTVSTKCLSIDSETQYGHQQCKKVGLGEEDADRANSSVQTSSTFEMSSATISCAESSEDVESSPACGTIRHSQDNKHSSVGSQENDVISDSHAPSSSSLEHHITSIKPLNRTAFSGFRSALGERNGSRQARREEDDRRKIECECELFRHLSDLEAEKKSEIDELRRKLLGRDTVLEALEQNAMIQGDTISSLRAKVDELGDKLAEKKAIMEEQANMIIKCQVYIEELTEELERIYEQEEVAC